MKLIECQGSPRDMGRQYGEQARQEIRRDLELRGNNRKLLVSAGFTATAKRAIESFYPDLMEELEGLSEGAGVELASVLRANHVDTFAESEIFDPEAEGCTPVMLKDSPEGVIVAKNNDGPADEDYPFIIRRCRPDRGIPFIHVTYAGWLSGLDAINAEGLANTHGSVGSVFDKSGLRLDIRLWIYGLMQSCRSRDQFIRELAKIPLTGKGFSVAVGDLAGNTAILDAAVPFVAAREVDRQFSYSTNLYMSKGLEKADMRPLGKRDICLFRHGYLRWIEATNPPRRLADIKSLLGSHDPWAPCRHGGPHRSKTLWSMINLPQSGKVLIADGSPCTSEFVEFGF